MSEQNELVIDIGEGRDFYGLGARVHRLVHPKTTGSDQVGVSVAMHGPGEIVKRHRHPYEEAYYVIKGEGVMYMEGREEIELHPGRAVYIPPETIHGQRNTSDVDDLWILCSLSPPPPEGETPELFE
ncbi:MAG: cupin domain-containing protein [Actinobacteria bacterium]|nr:cupin domain-containing protein [Actinomycetota bacterium]